MKRRKFVQRVKSTQQQQQHAHDQIAQEVRDLALDIMAQLVEAPDATADINDITHALGADPDDDKSWSLFNAAIGYLKRGGAIEAVTFCEHECLHEVRAVAIAPLVPVIDENRTVKRLVCLGCGKKSGMKPDVDENGVIYGFFEKVS